MSPSPLSVSSADALPGVAQLMRDNAIRHVPVVDDGELVGVLSDRDIAAARTLRSRKLSELAVRDVMSDLPLTVGPGDLLSDVAALMVDRRVSAAVVVLDGEVVGMFTTLDALLALHRICAPRA